METKKYIIEIPDNTAWIQWVKVSDKDGHVCFDFKDPEDLTPYTEPDIDAIRNEAYEKGVQDTKQHWVDAPRSCAYRLGYENGLNDAWEAARKIACDRAHGGFHIDTKRHIFGAADYAYILANYNAFEATEKIRQYEQEKEELGIQGYFKRGDEVIDADGTKAVILRVSEDNYCQVYTKNGCIYNWHIYTYKFHKTGRNFPEIVEVLRKMRDEET